MFDQFLPPLLVFSFGPLRKTQLFASPNSFKRLTHLAMAFCNSMNLWPGLNRCPGCFVGVDIFRRFSVVAGKLASSQRKHRKTGTLVYVTELKTRGLKLLPETSTESKLTKSITFYSVKISLAVSCLGSTNAVWMAHLCRRILSLITLQRSKLHQLWTHPGKINLKICHLERKTIFQISIIMLIFRGVTLWFYEWFGQDVSLIRWYGCSFLINIDTDITQLKKHPLSEAFYISIWKLLASNVFLKARQIGGDLQDFGCHTRWDSQLFGVSTGGLDSCVVTCVSQVVFSQIGIYCCCLIPTGTENIYETWTASHPCACIRVIF